MMHDKTTVINLARKAIHQIEGGDYIHEPDGLLGFTAHNLNLPGFSLQTLRVAEKVSQKVFETCPDFWEIEQQHRNNARIH